ncbi:hypothetical protein U1Q18_002186 [Sarracenia purpurea var. burkii]
MVNSICTRRICHLERPWHIFDGLYNYFLSGSGDRLRQCVYWQGVELDSFRGFGALYCWQLVFIEEATANIILSNGGILNVENGQIAEDVCKIISHGNSYGIESAALVVPALRYPQFVLEVLKLQKGLNHITERSNALVE